ncbi:hypothetical protein BDP27DRAFT_1413525 [Rhodocollybia butyracea]|uniref:Uncharacterized protein n=1 Tax=Rhodocollybia butyracea TaxID=206335 RepID=A0A9P5UGT6_9AGAR|nr:hypothetical protein BDP27DRAFT_1413525 [Rhodocollybia butyracea]
MSFFERSYGFQVNGGKFYAVTTSDVNIERAPSSSSTSNFVQTSRVQRSAPGGARYTPYSVSNRRLTSLASSQKPTESSTNSGTMMASDTSRALGTLDSTRFPTYLPQSLSQLSGTTDSLYPSSGQLLSSALPPIINFVLVLDQTMPYTQPTSEVFICSKKQMIFPINIQRSIHINLKVPRNTDCLR